MTGFNSIVDVVRQPVLKHEPARCQTMPLTPTFVVSGGAAEKKLKPDVCLSARAGFQVNPGASITVDLVARHHVETVPSNIISVRP